MLSATMIVEIIMRVEGFANTSVQRGERWVPALVAKCDKCGFQASEYVSTSDKFDTDGVGQRARVIRKFENLGWSFRNHKATCPGCMKASRAAQMRFLHSPKGAPMPTENVTKFPPLPPAGVKPMGKSDRRVIFIKLDEVYQDEKKGYLPGWTDQRVATDLGIPEAWVKEIREENFGSVSSNPDIDLVLAEAKKWEDERGVLERRASALADQIEKIVGEAKKMAEEFQKHTAKGELVERKLFAISKSVRP